MAVVRAIAGGLRGNGNQRSEGTVTKRGLIEQRIAERVN
jgi:hypothetical protein